MTTYLLPPGPRSRAPWGQLRAFRGDPLQFLQDVAREHGDVAGYRLGPQRVVFLNRPELIRDVLVTHHRCFHKGRVLQRAKALLGEGLLTSEGAFHTRRRRLAQPAFHRRRVTAHGEAMVRHALRAQGRWRPGERFDAAAEMGRLTLAIAAETMFGADLEGEAEELGRALTDSLELFDLLTVPFSEQLLRLPLPRTRRFHAARERLDRTIYRLIAERRARGEDRGDLLSMLLEAQDAEGDEGADGDMQLRDEALTLFLAGHETTANALAWTWFLLAQHPAVERRLHAELDAVLGGRPPTVGDLPRLRYARMVLSEAMRLYPPAWAVARLALEDYRVGPYTAPRGSIVLMSQWVTHRDPRWWPEPERFDPDRWTPEGEAGRPRFSYFPFGGGPRVCIGEAFAWMEGTLVMAAIGQRWRLRLAPGARVAPRPLITLRPRDGMPMLAERR